MKTRKLFLSILTVLCGFYACQQPAEELVQASLQSLLQPEGEPSQTTVGQFGGSGTKAIPPLELQDASLKKAEEGLELQFGAGGTVQFTPLAAGLPASWRNYGQLQLQIESKQEGQLLLMVYGLRTRLIDTLNLQPGLKAYRTDIAEVPLLGGTEAAPLYLKVQAVQKTGIWLRALALVPQQDRPALVDRWGQRARADYPAKVQSLEELRDNEQEQQFLAALPPLPAHDRFGGYARHSLPLQATGFFRTQQAGDRWWLVTPEGNPFFSLGLNGVRVKSFRSNADVTRVTGRQDIFEAVPEVAECPECFREGGDYFSFYCWNIKRKYSDLQSWRRQSYQRLKALGFNTIGNWSDTLFYQQPSMPYTFTLDSRKDSAFLMANGLPDVFHPRWEQHLAGTFADIARFKDDPFLLGYFVDNEMGWRSVNRIDPLSYSARYLQASTSPEEQRKIYAEQYFATIQKAIRQFDPNHLYLGCRFTRNFREMEAIATAAGQWADVISVNIYSAWPKREETDQWYNAAKKPLLIGEHHIPPVTRKQLLPHYPAFVDAERYAMITDYVLKWAAFPYALGSHWYQFKDQEVAGREDGGENQPVGLVTIADRLNLQLAETYHQISRQLPEVLFGEQ